MPTTDRAAPWRDGAPTRAALTEARDAHVTAIVDHVAAAVTASRQVLGGYQLTIDVGPAPMPDDDTGHCAEIVNVELGGDHWDAVAALDDDTYEQHADVVGDGLVQLLDQAIGALGDAGLEPGRIAQALQPATEAARNV